MPHDVMGPIPWPSYRWDENGHEAGGGPGAGRHWDQTVVLPRVDPKLGDSKDGANALSLLKDALDLVVELWPQPGYASVTLETHQWVKLRRVLLAVPDLVAGDE